MADHGYQPLKPQVDEGELTLSILSTFDGDAEPEASYYGVCPHHAGVEGNVGFGSRSGCRTGCNVQTGTLSPVQGRKELTPGYGITAR